MAQTRGSNVEQFNYALDFFLNPKNWGDQSSPYIWRHMKKSYIKGWYAYANTTNETSIEYSSPIAGRAKVEKLIKYTLGSFEEQREVAYLEALGDVLNALGIQRIPLSTSDDQPNPFYMYSGHFFGFLVKRISPNDQFDYLLRQLASIKECCEQGQQDGNKIDLFAGHLISLLATLAKIQSAFIDGGLKSDDPKQEAAAQEALQNLRDFKKKITKYLRVAGVDNSVIYAARKLKHLDEVARKLRIAEAESQEVREPKPADKDDSLPATQSTQDHQGQKYNQTDASTIDYREREDQAPDEYYKLPARGQAEDSDFQLAQDADDQVKSALRYLKELAYQEAQDNAELSALGDGGMSAIGYAANPLAAGATFIGASVLNERLYFDPAYQQAKRRNLNRELPRLLNITKEMLRLLNERDLQHTEITIDEHRKFLDDLFNKHIKDYEVAHNLLKILKCPNPRADDHQELKKYYTALDFALRYQYKKLNNEREIVFPEHLPLVSEMEPGKLYVINERGKYTYTEIEYDPVNPKHGVRVTRDLNIKMEYSFGYGEEYDDKLRKLIYLETGYREPISKVLLNIAKLTVLSTAVFYGMTQIVGLSMVLQSFFIGMPGANVGFLFANPVGWVLLASLIGVGLHRGYKVLFNPKEDKIISKLNIKEILLAPIWQTSNRINSYLGYALWLGLLIAAGFANALGIALMPLAVPLVIKWIFSFRAAWVTGKIQLSLLTEKAANVVVENHIGKFIINSFRAISKAWYEENSFAAFSVFLKVALKVACTLLAATLVLSMIQAVFLNSGTSLLSFAMDALQRTLVNFNINLPAIPAWADVLLVPGIGYIISRTLTVMAAAGEGLFYIPNLAKALFDKLINLLVDALLLNPSKVYKSENGKYTHFSHLSLDKKVSALFWCAVHPILGLTSLALNIIVGLIVGVLAAFSLTVMYAIAPVKYLYRKFQGAAETPSENKQDEQGEKYDYVYNYRNFWKTVELFVVMLGPNTANANGLYNLAATTAPDLAANFITGPVIRLAAMLWGLCSWFSHFNANRETKELCKEPAADIKSSYAHQEPVDASEEQAGNVTKLFSSAKFEKCDESSTSSKSSKSSKITAMGKTRLTIYQDNEKTRDSCVPVRMRSNRV